MSRYNIEHNGKFACFSSISDDFITEFLDKDEYEEWRKREYGIQYYRHSNQCNIMSLEESIFSIRLNRTREESLNCLYKCGLSKTECDQLMYDMETKYYCPIPKGNGKYECPNCHSNVDIKQLSCVNNDCCLDFVWHI